MEPSSQQQSAPCLFSSCCLQWAILTFLLVVCLFFFSSSAAVCFFVQDPSLEPWVREERALLQELTTYADTLDNIQKALGDYLEKQRVAFPRFYFIGDDALLEIIGNARTPVKVSTHLPKLFAGIASLAIADDQRTVTAMVSSEGEVVPFQQSVVVTDESSVHQWLSAVQHQMRFTLAMLLERSVDQILRFDADESLTYDREQKQAYAQTIGSFFGWVDAFPAQIVILSSQVHWSQSVEQALDGSAKAAASLRTVLARTETTLDMLTERILHADIRPDARKKYEQVSNSRDHHGAVIASERLVEMHGSATDFSVTALFFSALTVFLADHGEGSPARRDPRAVGQRRVAR